MAKQRQPEKTCQDCIGQYSDLAAPASILHNVYDCRSPYGYYRALGYTKQDFDRLDPAAKNRLPKQLRLKWHPDKRMGKEEEEATKVMAALNQAIGVLFNDNKKAEYDQKQRRLAQSHSQFPFRGFYRDPQKAAPKRRQPNHKPRSVPKRKERVSVSAVKETLSRPEATCSTRKKIKILARFLRQGPGRYSSWGWVNFGQSYEEEVNSILIRIINSCNIELIRFAISRLSVDRLSKYKVRKNLYSESYMTLVAHIIFKFKNNPQVLTSLIQLLEQKGLPQSQWKSAFEEYRAAGARACYGAGQSKISLSLAEYIVFELKQPTLLRRIYHDPVQALSDIDFQKIFRRYCNVAIVDELRPIAQVIAEIPAAHTIDYDFSYYRYGPRQNRNFLELLIAKEMYKECQDILRARPTDGPFPIKLDHLMLVHPSDNETATFRKLIKVFTFIKQHKQKLTPLLNLDEFHKEFFKRLAELSRKHGINQIKKYSHVLQLIRDITGDDIGLAHSILRAGKDIRDGHYWIALFMENLFEEEHEVWNNCLKPMASFKAGFLRRSNQMGRSGRKFVCDFIARYREKTTGIAGLAYPGDNTFRLWTGMLGNHLWSERDLYKGKREYSEHKRVSNLSLILSGLFGIIYAPINSLIVSVILNFNTFRYGLPSFVRSKETLLEKVGWGAAYVLSQLILLPIIAVIQLALSPISGLILGFSTANGITSAVNPYEHYLTWLISGIHGKIWRLSTRSEVNLKLVQHVSALYKSRRPEHVILALAILTAGIMFTLTMTHVFSPLWLGSLTSFLQGLSVLTLAGVTAGACIAVGVIILGLVWSVRTLRQHRVEEHSMFEHYDYSSGVNAFNADKWLQSLLQDTKSSAHDRLSHESEDIFGHFSASSGKAEESAMPSFKTSSMAHKFKTQDPNQALRRWAVAELDNPFADFQSLIKFSDINAQDSNPRKRFTALHLALRSAQKAHTSNNSKGAKAYIKRAKLLLDYGAKVDIRDAKGITARKIITEDGQLYAALGHYLPSSSYSGTHGFPGGY